MIIEISNIPYKIISKCTISTFVEVEAVTIQMIESNVWIVY